MYEYRERRYGKRRGFVDPFKMERETRVGIQKLKRDVRVGGKWVVGKAKKEYGKAVTLRGTKIYAHPEGDFIKYYVVYQDGSMWKLSDNPLSPMGQLEYIDNVEKIGMPYGKKISLSDTPWEVKRAIKKIAAGEFR